MRQVGSVVLTQERMSLGESGERDTTLKRWKELPGKQRFCSYASEGHVSYRLCTSLFQCATCEFSQMTEDMLQQKLGVEQEAVGQKESPIRG